MTGQKQGQVLGQIFPPSGGAQNIKQHEKGQ